MCITISRGYARTRIQRIDSFQYYNRIDVALQHDTKSQLERIRSLKILMYFETIMVHLLVTLRELNAKVHSTFFFCPRFHRELLTRVYLFRV